MGQFKIAVAIFSCLLVVFSDCFRFGSKSNPASGKIPCGNGYGSHRYPCTGTRNRRHIVNTDGNFNDVYGTESGGFRERRSRYGFQELGCSCLLYVERTEVFRRTLSNLRAYSCNLQGLVACVASCTRLFSDAALRAQSRQDACDVLNRPVFSNWYRRNQVCGRRGFRNDIQLSVPLCCRGGRSSAECSNNTFTNVGRM